MSYIVSVTLLVAVLTTPSFASPVRLTIQLDSASALPATPVTLHVEALNPTTQPVTIPNAVAMQVTPRTGSPFVAIASHRGEIGVTSFPDERDEEITLAPGERRDLTFWASLDSPLFGRDARFYVPGEYRLQLFVDEALRNLDFLDVHTLSTVEELSDPITSNEVALTLSVPEGDDAAVFEWIASSSAPTTWNAELAERIWREFPNSHYAPYAVPANLRDSEREAKLLDAAIAKIPDSPVADWYRLSLSKLRDNYPQIRTEDDVRVAARMAADVRSLLEDLVQRARERRLRDLAQKALAEVPTRDRLTWLLRLNRGELTDIEPEVVCVSEYAKGKSVAWISYFNPTAETKSVPIGSRNKFTPPPFDRGQPRVFLPNTPTVSHLFKVTFDSPSVTWHIDATNLHIAAAKAVRVCPSDMEENYAEYYTGERSWPGPTGLK